MTRYQRLLGNAERTLIGAAMSLGLAIAEQRLNRTRVRR